MIKLLALIFTVTASILGQIVMYNLTEKYLPQYLQMYVIAIVLVWIGIVCNIFSEV